MEILFSQKLEYAIITPRKNYSSLSEKRQNGITPIYDGYDVYDGGFLGPNRKTKGKIVQCLLDLPKKKKGKYFYSDPEQLDVPIFLKEYRHGNNIPFYTTKQRHIQKHCFNPFSSITIYKIERSIVKRGDKITLKLFQRIKRREFNWKFFKTSSTISSITINTITGNFTLARITSNPEGKTGKTFRVNYFPELLMSVNNNFNGLFQMSNMYESLPVNEEYKNEFNDIEFIDNLNKTLGFDNKVVDIKNRNIRTEKNLFVENFLKYFINARKIKAPDNYLNFMSNYYPTEKYLKKNDRKLATAILDKFNIKSDITNKILHLVPDIDICTLAKLCCFFGENYTKYVGSIKLDKFDVIDNKMVLGDVQTFEMSKDIIVQYTITDREKENIVSILNSIEEQKPEVVVGQIQYFRADKKSLVRDFCQSLNDHFRMIKELRPYFPDICLQARTYKNYNAEHVKYSQFCSIIQKEYMIEFAFDEDIINDIETRVEMFSGTKYSLNDDDYFYPVLLKKEEDYIEEGSFMHHCVGGYVNHDNSIIISLRTKDGDERVTCEFDVKSGSCLQARYMMNTPYPQKFEYALSQLKNKVIYLAGQHKLKWLDKHKVKTTLNGIEVETKNMNENRELDLWEQVAQAEILPY